MMLYRMYHSMYLFPSAQGSVEKYANSSEKDRSAGLRVVTAAKEIILLMIQ